MTRQEKQCVIKINSSKSLNKNGEKTSAFLFNIQAASFCLFLFFFFIPLLVNSIEKKKKNETNTTRTRRVSICCNNCRIVFVSILFL